MDEATVGFVRHSDAKQRRDLLSPFFSRTSILQMQDLIKERVGLRPTDKNNCFVYKPVRWTSFAMPWLIILRQVREPFKLDRRRGSSF